MFFELQSPRLQSTFGNMECSSSARVAPRIRSQVQLTQRPPVLASDGLALPHPTLVNAINENRRSTARAYGCAPPAYLLSREQHIF